MRTTEGLAGGGNDDLGEMSAWYILSRLGFYPVDPGVPYFEVCTPRFPIATLHLGIPETSFLHRGKNVIALHVHHAGDGRHFADATVTGLTLRESK